MADEGLLRADDNSIWDHAQSHAQVIISKDDDFPKRKILEPIGPQIVWLRVGNCSNAVLIAWFAPLFSEVIRRLDEGDGIVEVV